MIDAPWQPQAGAGRGLEDVLAHADRQPSFQHVEKLVLVGMEVARRLLPPHLLEFDDGQPAPRLVAADERDHLVHPAVI